MSCLVLVFSVCCRPTLCLDNVDCDGCCVCHARCMEDGRIPKDIQSGYPRHNMVAPLNGPNSASGAIFRTTIYTVYANVITTQSSFWCHQALISCPCDQHFSDSHQNPLGFTPKACFFLKKNIRLIKFPKFRESL